MIKKYQETGRELSRILRRLLEMTKPGVKLEEIEAEACRLIKKTGGKASFKMVPNYSWATCININDGIVHGIPENKIIKAGDVVSIDIGLYKHGLHTDMAYTIEVETNKFKDFLNTGKIALEKAIKQVNSNNRVGHISKAIQQTIEKSGYNCVPWLTGHGIGKELHMRPWVPNVLRGKIKSTPKLQSSTGLAIEVIYNYGRPGMETCSDGWTIKTKDGKISALFEKDVFVTDKGYCIITPDVMSGI